MKQGVSPAVAAVVIVVVVLIIGAVGYFTVFKSSSADDEAPIDMTADVSGGEDFATMDGQGGGEVLDDGGMSEEAGMAGG